MNYFSAFSKIDFLGRINPEIYDIIRQIGTRFSEGSRLVMSAMVIKSIAMETRNEEVRTQLNKVGKELFNAGVKSMNYEEDTWYCGTPYPLHFSPRNPSVRYWEEEERERLLAELLHFHTGDPVFHKYLRSELLISLSNSIQSKDLSARLSKIGHQIAEDGIRKRS